MKHNAEQIGAGQKQRDNRVLVFGIGTHDIQANTLGLQGLVEQAVAESFF